MRYPASRKGANWAMTSGKSISALSLKSMSRMSDSFGAWLKTPIDGSDMLTFGFCLFCELRMFMIGFRYRD